MIYLNAGKRNTGHDPAQLDVFRSPGGQARARRDTLVERRGKAWRKVMAIAEIFHRLRESAPPIWLDRARRVFIVIGSRVCAPARSSRNIPRSSRRRYNKVGYALVRVPERSIFEGTPKGFSYAVALVIEIHNTTIVSREFNTQLHVTVVNLECNMY